MIYKAHPAIMHGESPLRFALVVEDPAGFSPFRGTSKDWTRFETYSTISGDRRITIAVTEDGRVHHLRMSISA